MLKETKASHVYLENSTEGPMPGEQWEGALMGPWSGDVGKVGPFSFSEQCPPQTRSFRRPHVNRQKGTATVLAVPSVGCRTLRFQRTQFENCCWAQWEVQQSGMSRPVFYRIIPTSHIRSRGVNLKAILAKDGQEASQGGKGGGNRGGNEEGEAGDMSSWWNHLGMVSDVDWLGG